MPSPFECRMYRLSLLSVLTLASRFFFYGFSGIIPLTEENRSNFPIRPNLLRVRLQMALKFVS